MSEYKSRIAIVGFPNSGKTTLFNQLTGLRQKIGNWPGVTVDKKAGELSLPRVGTVEVVDLPGIYSLLSCEEEESLDAKIARRFVLDNPPALLINVVDGIYLERELYLTYELLELGLPQILVISKTELARRRGIEISEEKLREQLGIPVFLTDEIEADHLKENIDECLLTPKSACPDLLGSYATLPKEIRDCLHDVPESDIGRALHYMEGDVVLNERDAFTLPNVEMEEEADLLIAEWRFEKAHRLAQSVMTVRPVIRNELGSKLDKYFLHAFWGIPSFLTVMYLLFTLSIGFGGVLQPMFDLASEELLVDLPVYLGHVYHWPHLLTALIAGIGKGVNTTLTFIPVLFFMYLFLSFLEQSGYMVRAAVIVDRLMRQIGLSGKAFIPLIIGLGCNVPAVMATRALENPRDRILTSLMSPFMSCGARLAIYSVFVALFFDRHAHLIVFSLYVVGILAAILTGLLVKQFMMNTQQRPLIMDLPHYQLPTFTFMLKQSWTRVSHFIFRTGRIIVPLCMVLTLLSRFDLHGQWLEVDTGHSLLAEMGRRMAFIFQPMGVSESNWPAVIGLLSGTVAKEVVVGTLNTLYYAPDLVAVSMPDVYTLPSRLLDLSAEQLQAMLFWVVHPWQALLASNEISAAAGSALVKEFHSRAAAYAYLLFVLLYVPCFSTVAVIKRELNAFWAWFSVFWSIFIAYIAAVFSYQILTIGEHWQTSLGYMLRCVIFTALVMWFLKHVLENKQLSLWVAK